MIQLLIVCLIISFLCSVVFTRWWIRRAEKAGLTANDVHKPGRKVAELGGIPVVASFLVGILLFVGYRTFVLKITADIYTIMGVVSTVLIITVIGMVDDILGWKIGLSQWQKPLLTLFAALPMMMINAGISSMNLPFLGVVDLGILYPLIIIPIAIMGASNAFNMIAGYNGLEAGMGIAILGGLGAVAWLHEGLGVVGMISGAMMFALIGFIVFNLYPAKIFPGDTLTYSVGAVIACVAILGNVEKMALFLFIPYFVQFLLKARGLMRKESFSAVEKDGSLKPKYDKVYGVEHIAVRLLRRFKKKAWEHEVTFVLIGVEVILVMISSAVVFL